MSRRYRRYSSMFESLMLFIGAIGLLFVVATMRALFGAWLMMLAFMHMHDVWATVPALGFWQILLPSLFLGWWVAVNSYQGKSSNKD